MFFYRIFCCRCIWRFRKLSNFQSFDFFFWRNHSYSSEISKVPFQLSFIKNHKTLRIDKETIEMESQIVAFIEKNRKERDFYKDNPTVYIFYRFSTAMHREGNHSWAKVEISESPILTNHDYKVLTSQPADCTYGIKRNSCFLWNTSAFRNFSMR